MIAAGGSYVEALVAGAILGLLSVVLDTVRFGVILGRRATAGTLAAAFGFSTIVFGAVLGAGFTVSRQAATTPETEDERRATSVAARSF